MPKRISYPAALDNLKMLFRPNTGGTTVTVEEAYVAAGRDLTQVERNKSWLREKVADLKYYQLAEPVYAEGTPKIVEGLRLTPQGKKALDDLGVGADLVASGSMHSQATPSLDTIMGDVASYQHHHPELKLVFYVTLREEADAGVLHAMMPIHPGNP